MFTDLGMTAMEKEAFTMGDCWRLAKAVNHLTGWTMVAFVCRNQDHKGELRDWNHMGVITPQGDYLDVEGVQSPEDAVTAWKSDFTYCCDIEGKTNCATLVPMTQAQWEGMVDGQEPQYEQEADPLVTAQELLAAYIEHMLTSKQVA